MKSIRTILTVIMLSATAHAGLFVEPMLTYETSDSSVDYPAPFSNSTGSAAGLGVGLRLGLHFKEVIFGGIDMRYSNPKFKDSSVNYDAKALAFNWGPVIGAQMPITGLRVWGSYLWGGSFDPESSGGYDVKFEQASGFRLGGGFQFILVGLNLEYQEVNYASTTLEQAGPFAPGTFGDPHLQNKSWILSFSFPVEM